MILIVHGYDGSGPGHFQHWLASELRARGERVVFPELPSPAEPVLDEWVGELRDILDASAEPATIVAHSLGCWAVDHLVHRHGAEKIGAALLVAPPSPYSLFEPIQGFLPPPRDRAAWAPVAARTRVIGSDDDAYADEDEFAELAETLGVSHLILKGAGHINADAGFGPFPRALEWVTNMRGR